MERLFCGTSSGKAGLAALQPGDRDGQSLPVLQGRTSGEVSPQDLLLPVHGFKATLVLKYILALICICSFSHEKKPASCSFELGARATVTARELLLSVGSCQCGSKRNGARDRDVCLLQFICLRRRQESKSVRWSAWLR